MLLHELFHLKFEHLPTCDFWQMVCPQQFLATSWVKCDVLFPWGIWCRHVLFKHLLLGIKLFDILLTRMLLLLWGSTQWLIGWDSQHSRRSYYYLPFENLLQIGIWTSWSHAYGIETGPPTMRYVAQPWPPLRTLILTRPLVNGLFAANVPNTLELSFNSTRVMHGSWLFAYKTFHTW